MVAVSGGKDSYALLAALRLLQQRAPVRFTLEAVNLDPQYPGYQPEIVKKYVESLDVPITMLDAPIHQLVQDKLSPGQPACPLCSRIRRGAFYTLCRERGFNKLALGHHLDDAIETLLMNMFYSGAMRAMPPLLERDEIIRPGTTVEGLAKLSPAFEAMGVQFGLDAPGCLVQQVAHGDVPRGALRVNAPVAIGRAVVLPVLVALQEAMSSKSRATVRSRASWGSR